MNKPNVVCKLLMLFIWPRRRLLIPPAIEQSDQLAKCAAESGKKRKITVKNNSRKRELCAATITIGICDFQISHIVNCVVVLWKRNLSICRKFFLKQKNNAFSLDKHSVWAVESL